MLRRIRRLPSPALVIASVALVLAVGGGSAALAITDNAKDKKIAKKQANKAITARAPGLSVNHANSATNADNATNATNATQLGGVPASGYTRNDCNSLTGQVKGFAIVPGNVAATLTNVFGYNCSGGTVQAQHTSTGEYHVVFANNPAILAVVTEHQTGAVAPNVDSIGTSAISGGNFNVGVYNDPTNTLINDGFGMVMP